jgi:hypothetical protein
LLHESVEEFAAVQGEATVEAEREFVGVGLKVRGRDGASVSAAQPSFKPCLSGCVPKAENLEASPAVNKGGKPIRIPWLARNPIGMV